MRIHLIKKKTACAQYLLEVFVATVVVDFTEERRSGGGAPRSRFLVRKIVVQVVAAAPVQARHDRRRHRRRVRWRRRRRTSSRCSSAAVTTITTAVGCRCCSCGRGDGLVSFCGDGLQFTGEFLDAFLRFSEGHAQLIPLDLVLVIFTKVEEKVREQPRKSSQNTTISSTSHSSHLTFALPRTTRPPFPPFSFISILDVSF